MSRQNPPLIAHVIYCLTTGGLENGLVNIINRMPFSRYRHVIVCITGADDFARRITANDVRVIELHKRAGHDFWFYWRLWKLFRQLRPDVIHSRNLAALETQLLGLGLPGVRRIHGEHGREINDLDGTNWKYLNFRKFMRTFIHCYIAVSADLEQWLIEKVGVRRERIRQIYNGVDRTKFSPDNVKASALLPPHWQGVDGMLVVGTVGRLTPVKNQQVLLQAAVRLRDLHPDLFRRLRVVIVGDGPLRSELTDLVTKLRLESVVWLAGDRDDVPELLATMDIFALPSLAEGVSNTVLEAMAFGLPAVVTAVGGNLELVEEGFNGSLVPVGDSQALAQALLFLLEHPAERQRQGANARQRVAKRFDWEQTVNAYMDAYDEVLQSRASKQTESLE